MERDSRCCPSAHIQRKPSSHSVRGASQKSQTYIRLDEGESRGYRYDSRRRYSKLRKTSSSKKLQCFTFLDVLLAVIVSERTFHECNNGILHGCNSVLGI